MSKSFKNFIKFTVFITLVVACVALVFTVPVLEEMGSNLLKKLNLIV
jgi:hypothetical protein